MKKLAHLFISILFIAGMSACNQQELDNLQSQIDELKSTQIASISSQISSIQASISSLEKMDTELKSHIDELTKKEQELESTDEAQAKEIGTLRETLTQLETSLSKRIDDLKTYVDEELKKQKDWVSATFSTLEQYQNTCDEIASIKETLTNQETALKALVSETESSIKGWVNEQLTSYYTIAEMDAKISALEKAITDRDETQAKELEKLRADLETAKADIKAACEKAISDAITEFEGKINEKIAADIKAANDALQGQIDEINTKIVDIEKRLGIIEESLEKILARVQSIVVVPNYINSKVLFKESEDTDILFEVSPRSASVALAQQDISVFSLDAVLTQTKASMFDVHFPIKSVRDNGECLVVTIDAANMDMEAIDKAEYLNSYSGRLKIDDGFNSMTTEYFTLVSDSDYTTYPLRSLRDYFESNLEEGQQNTIREGWRIKAEVISNSALNNVASSRLMFVQDYSAGIAIYCNAPHGCTFGDVLTIDLSNATITRYDGYLEVTNISPDKIKKIGHKDNIEPKEVSIEDFLANKYESQYVAITDVQVVNDDLEKTWVINGAGTQIGIECLDGSEFVVFSRKNASYGAETVPQGSGTIKGVASRYNDVIQLFFAQNTDWAGLTETRFTLEEHNYTLSIGADTKAGISDNQMVWKAGDKVFLSDGSTSVLCTIPDEYNGQTTATVKTKQHLSNNVLCIYPGESVTQEGDYFYVDIPEDQGADGSKYMVCSGSSTSNYIQLPLRNTLMKVTLKSDVDDLDYIRITVEGSPIVGRLKIDEQGVEVISGTQAAKVSAHGDNVFYFSVLPGSITRLDLDVNKTDGAYGRKTSSTSVTVNAGTLMNITLDPSKFDTVFAPEFNGLTFTASGEASIGLQKTGSPNTITLEYSKDGFSWYNYTVGDYIAFSDGEKLMFRAGKQKNQRFSSTAFDYYTFTSNGLGTFAASGNIMSLLDRDYNTPLSQSCFNKLFANCTDLSSAPELPATSLCFECYEAMFSGCTGLSSAPKLPAIVLAEDCYNGMFWGCTGLTLAPELPATNMKRSCYAMMFMDCIGLTKAPLLPATTLNERCYLSMFSGCTGLTAAPELPATTLAEFCYCSMFSGCSGLSSAPKLPATTLARGCYDGMFASCTGLAAAPELPATTLASDCYNSMFYGCTSLTTAPLLPAIVLLPDCYASMFKGCKNLNYIKALFKTTPGNKYTGNWLSGVSKTGTFVKASYATWDLTDPSGIPSGWTVQTE